MVTKAEDNKDHKHASDHDAKLKAHASSQPNTPKYDPEPHPHSLSPSAPVAPTQQAGPYDDLIALSGLNPGEEGYLILDDAGVATVLQRDPPAHGTPACRVLVNDNPDTRFDRLISIAGASLTANLNPRPEVRVLDNSIIPVAAPEAKVQPKK